MIKAWISQRDRFANIFNQFLPVIRKNITFDKLKRSFRGNILVLFLNCTFIYFADKMSNTKAFLKQISYVIHI